MAHTPTTRRVSPADVLSPAAVRWLPLTKLWHVGSFDAANKGEDSQEGNGLSVSLHPREWAAIAKLGDQAVTLRRAEGRFLAFHALTVRQRKALQDWGVASGLLELRPMWKLGWTDGEDGDKRYCLFDEENAARDEADFMRDEETEGVRLTKTSRAALTQKATERLGFKLSPVLALDIAATFWVEDCTDGDGVWWEDRLDPCALSAPRGVINLRQLSRWTASKPTGLR